jgi:hypothetical protein
MKRKNLLLTFHLDRKQVLQKIAKKQKGRKKSGKTFLATVFYGDGISCFQAQHLFAPKSRCCFGSG